MSLECLISRMVPSCHLHAIILSVQAANIKDCYAKLQQMVDIASIPPKKRKMRTVSAGISSSTQTTYLFTITSFQGLTKQAKKNRLEKKRRRSDVKKNRRVDSRYD